MLIFIDETNPTNPTYNKFTQLNLEKKTLQIWQATNGFSIFFSNYGFMDLWNNDQMRISFTTIKYILSIVDFEYSLFIMN